ncbi:small conductance mechanosensitive channel [Quadrisphaera granulorum]|uniref:Small conductance mechanosensitive channel n=1 Tax=Quadrisphaera granulorum TaxID=317664 RepID=A0A315ZRM9_9ACTN|nr:mechanosensitive ion channel domain-containing protein [Quadrisphaera granulorum]PWJ47364.1 small conductance mechanosensitive channel [Quadrisphaera granulorum]SZE98811.1 small conductance mechanosensitive channel [Quadrisphaera granulorum]
MIAAALTSVLAASASAAPSSPVQELTNDVTRSTEAASTLACSPGDGTWCGLMVNAGVNETFAKFLMYYGSPLLKIALILVAGLIVRNVAHSAIEALAERIASGEAQPGRSRWWRAGRGRETRASEASTASTDGTLAWERRSQRARTLGSVLRSLTTAVVMTVVALLVIGQLGIPLAPLLAGVSVVGVAVGFGAQTLVKDFLAGIFIIAEDQFGVGDSVNLSADAQGTVEAVSLRVTRLRGVDGTVWYVRNGDVLRVGNRSQGWSRAVLDIDVPYSADAARVAEVLDEVGEQFHADEDWRRHLLEEPQVWGIEALSMDKVVVRLAVRTAPLQQWSVSRELRARIKARFDAEGIGHSIDDPADPADDADDAPAPSLPPGNQGPPTGPSSHR